jgi:hypothetical protein
MFRALPCLVAVCSLAAASGAAAQTPPSQPARDTPTAATGGTAAVRGRIVDAATGRGLSRVQVRANTFNPNPGSPPPSPYPWQAMTDADGRYEIKGIPAGIYSIAATKTNYVRSAFGADRVEGAGKRLPIADGQTLEKIDLRLTRAGVITGRIVDEFGDPVTDVAVAPMRYQFVNGSRRLMQTGRGGTTNDIGEYRIYGLSPGQYYVSATLRNFMMQQDTTDRSGYAATYYPGTGNMSEAQRLTVVPGQTHTGINLTLLPIQTARASGMVIDTQGRPMASVGVTAVSGFGANGFFGGQTKADGTFVVTGLTPGEYTLRANLPGSQEQAAQALRIDGSDVSDLQLVLAKPSTIRGRVAFEAGGTPPKASTIRITALRTDAMLGGGGNVLVKDDLTFEMPVSAGRVFVRSPPSGPNWRLNRVLVNGIDVTDSGVDVPVNGSLGDVVVELTDHLYPITGHVIDAAGAIVPAPCDCFVIVFGQDPAGWTPGTRYLAAVRPQQEDVFRAKMPAGDYYAVAVAELEQGAWTDPDFLNRARELATKFTIAAGETKNLELPLVPAPVF